MSLYNFTSNQPSLPNPNVRSKTTGQPANEVAKRMNS